MTTLTREQFENLKALKCTVAYNRYGAYCIPLSSQHRPAAAAILGGQVYEPQTIEFIRSSCGSGDIVHAGTYFGDFLPALSGACRGKIWAFEPNQENYRCARITTLLNEIANVELFRSGLGAGRDSKPLLTADPDGLARGGSSKLLADGETSAGQTEMVPIISIDEAVPPERQVSVIQLDVEGHEQQALSGALRTIARCRPAIVVEILAESSLRTTDWLTRNILNLRYQLTGTIHGNSVFLPVG